MQPLFIFDISALIATGFIAAALLLLSVGAGIKGPVNRCFAVFVITVLGWSITLMSLRITFLTGIGNPQFMLGLAGMLFSISSPMLFSFAAHYKGIHKRFHDVMVIIGIVILLTMVYPMFTGQIVVDPLVAANGSTVITAKPLAWIYSVVPMFFFAGSFLILWRNRRGVGETFIAISPLLFFIGLVLDGLISLPFPFHSFCGAMGLAFTGYGVTRRQVFNPLRDLTSELRQEIKERAHTEIDLRESEEKFRTFSDQSPNMIFINKRGKVVYANSRCEELMGYSRNEILSDDFDFRSIIAPESIPIIEQNFAKHLAGEDVEPYEYCLVNNEGRKIDAIIQTRLIDYDGEKAILGIITDISIQKQTERLLQTLNLAALDMERSLDSGELIPIARDHLTKIGYLPRVYVAIDKPGGRSFADTMDQTAAKLSVDEFPELEQFLSSRAAILIRENDPMYLVIKDGIQPGLTFFNSALLTPLGVDGDGGGFVVVLGEDIKENDIPPLSVFANQIAASYRRAGLMDELGSSISRLKDTQEELAHAQRMEAIGRLSGGIAHDFNNILTAIHGCAELIDVELAQGDNAEVIQYAGEIKRAVRQASGLTQQLLTFSRKQVIERRNIELNTVIRNMDTLLKRVIGEDIIFSLELGDNLGIVSVDERQFEQVLMNLAVNARDAMPHGGRITVRTFKRSLSKDEASTREFAPGPYCVLTFSDTGFGMDADTRRRVFEPFFTTKEFGKGTGLGMSTVYGIVRQCEGHIVVESEPERGTTFLIYLPETGGAADDDSHLEDEKEAPFKGKETVLVVEDDETVRGMTRKTLERQGYEVYAAHDAATAVEVCHRDDISIDLVLTDVVMPGGMNGFELSNWLAENRPRIKVMFMSGYADESGTGREEQRHKHAFLKKPFSSRALLQTLREVCDGRAYR
jgi:PAS domain S-box-containing protein